MLKKILLTGLSLMLVSITTISAIQTHQSAADNNSNIVSYTEEAVSNSVYHDAVYAAEDNLADSAAVSEIIETNPVETETVTSTIVMTTKPTTTTTTRTTTTTATFKSTTTSTTTKTTQNVTTKSTTKSPNNSSYSAIYSASYFRNAGVINWGGYRWTWYSQKVLPGPGLNIPGRHVDSNGYVCDENNYICLAATSLSKGTVVDTPFGKQGKVYDSGCPYGTLDVYTNF